MNTTTHPQPLRNILKLEKGKPPLQTPYNGPGSERYLTPDFLRGKAAPEYARPNSTAIRVTDGDVIILWDGSNAGEVLRARDGMLASTMMKVIHNSDYDTGYFYYALKGWEDYLKGQTSGSGIPHVDKEILGDLSIFNCKKLEQTKIAEILSTVDQAIEQTEALIAKQQRVKTSLMQDLLTCGIDQEGNLRSEDTHEFKDSPLGRIPVEWEVRSINSISDFVTSGSRGWAQYYSDEGAVFLRIGNLTRDHINMRFDDTVFVRPPASAEVLRTGVLPGDVLISITADLGFIGVIPEGFGEGYVNQHVALIRISDPEVNQRFIGWFLQSRLGQIQIETNNESGAKAGLNLPTIQNLLVVSPPYYEQKYIVQILDTTAKMISHLQTEMDKQIHLKMALMQDLLTGKVSVTPLLKEVEISI